MGMMTAEKLGHVITLLAACACLVGADTGITCYNSTIQATFKSHDITVFQGAETIGCEDGFGCSKTVITKGGQTVGVTRGCGIYGCLGKSCFLLHGHRLCLYCCKKPQCNSAVVVTSELTMLSLSVIASWTLRKH